METSLHRQLKALYAEDPEQTEVALDGYRIDAIVEGALVEIQKSSLSAIRDKVRSLLSNNRVVVVKPIVRQKTLVKRAEKDGPVVGRRKSPKRGRLLDLFSELVYFTRVFPHRNLTLEAVLVDIEEWRYPGHGRRRRRRKNDHQVEDQRLVEVHQSQRFQEAADLLQILPSSLPDPFHTGHLASALEIPRWEAQRIAYCLRQCGAATEVGKEGNTRLYQECTKRRRRRSRGSKKKPA